MSFDRVLRATVVTLLVVTAGCAEESATGTLVTDAEAPADLDIIVPALTPQALTHIEIVERQPPSRPAAVFTHDAVGADEPESPDYTLYGEIFGPITTVGFTSTYAYSAGRHGYTGNVGRVATEATLTFDGQVIGRQPAVRQASVPYLLDFGARKEIWAEAYIFTDQACGLTIDGDSDHEAWWQWFVGAGAPKWGDAHASSQAFPPVSQPECGEEETEEAFGGSGGGGDGGGGGGWVTCWYWVTYDPYSGELIDAEFLFCDNVEGG